MTTSCFGLKPRGPGIGALCLWGQSSYQSRVVPQEGGYREEILLPLPSPAFCSPVLAFHWPNPIGVEPSRKPWWRSAQGRAPGTGQGRAEEGDKLPSWRQMETSQACVRACVWIFYFSNFTLLDLTNLPWINTALHSLNRLEEIATVVSWIRRGHKFTFSVIMYLIPFLKIDQNSLFIIWITHFYGFVITFRYFQWTELITQFFLEEKNIIFTKSPPS